MRSIKRIKEKLGRSRSQSPSSISNVGPQPGANTQLTPAASSALTPNAPSSLPSTTTLPRVSIEPRTEPGKRIYDAAIRGLEEEDQVLIRGLVVGDDIDGIKAAQDAVLAQQRKCDQERWTVSVKGHTFGLGDVAGSLSLLLGKLQPGIDLVSQAVGVIKPGIDLAADLDPLHIGVPVALLKATLGVVVFYQSQMETLLSGMKTATYMLMQLSLYFEYFKRAVGSAAATLNLEQVLVDSYTLVLRFLAIGHRVLAKRGPKKTVELLWSKDEVDKFEEECKAAGTRLETAANHCNRDGASPELSEVKKQIDATLSEVKKLDIIAATVQALGVKVDLSRLVSAPDAAYDCVSKGGTLFDYCLAGTRKSLIEEITLWCRESHQTVFLISGMAGTGKSTLARTVARQIEGEGLLAASFFFRQDKEFQSNGSRFVPTIVSQLLTRYPILRPIVADALDSDLTLPGGSLSNQTTKLLKEPLIQAGLRKVVIIIDALDECRAEDARIILSHLAQLARQVDVRIAITSRPEREIQEQFVAFPPDSTRLEKVSEEETEDDIRQFLQVCFADLARDDKAQQAPLLQPGWPDPAMVEELVQLTKPLFIFAATLFRYVKSRDEPDRCLSEILKRNRSHNFKGMQQVYLPILEHIYGQAEEEDIATFKEVVGSILLVRDPQSMQVLSGLLCKRVGAVENSLKPLHSVLQIPDQPNERVSTLHKSFRDFLLESEHEFRIDTTATNQRLLEGCLRIMEDKLCNDVCKVSAPGTRRADFDEVSAHITPQLAYACQYWVSHIDKAQIDDGGRVHQFLKSHFLHWLEALSWLGRLSSAIAYISEMRSHVKINECREISAFLDDALRFIRMNRYVIDLAPLQAYHSALVFAPRSSIIKKTYQDKAQERFKLLPDVTSRWSAEIQKLEGHDGMVAAVAFSHDSKLLASASIDKTVRIWDAATGEEIQKLKGHDDIVTAVAFSHDSKLLASASGDKTVRIWDMEIGKEIQKFKGHTYWVTAVTFSHDSKILASASYDKTVKIWDIAIGKERQKLKGHGSGVTAVAFSHDSKLLASAPDDKTVRVWDMVIGKERQKLKGHNDLVHAVAFSHDSRLLASASYDKTVRIWDMEIGKERQKLKGHNGPVNAVAFSCDSKSVASASEDKTVRIWDMDKAIGKERQKLEGHSSGVTSVAFSHDSKLLASASDDGTVRIWDTVVTGGKTQKLKGHNGSVNAVAFSYDSKLVASASKDKTVRIWDMDKVIGKERQKLEGHNDWVTAVAFSHDSKLLVSASRDRTVRIWDIGTDTVMGKERQKMGKEILKLKWHDDWITAVAFSHDSKLLALASRDGIVRIWDIGTDTVMGKERQKMGKEILKLKGHDDWITAVAFSHDSKLLASASDYETIRIWDAATGEERRKLEVTGMITEVKFSADGSSLRANAGDFQLGLNITSQDELSRLPTALHLRDEWVCYQGQDVLWLPHDYRGRCSAASESTLVIGQASGAISFFRV